MEAQRLILSRENPRKMAFTTAKTVPNDLATKPQISILDRYRALLKERDDKLRVFPEDDVSPPTTDEMVQIYDILLLELTFNCKPIITDLTIVAGEQREHAKGIADAICARILEAPVEQKLPSLYLLDSIVKNIGREYIKYFSTKLPEVFCEAYRQVHPDLYSAMRHLFCTWSACFPPSVLCRIEAQLQFSPVINQRSSGFPMRSSESPQPTHGIHVNPKYLRQLQQSTVDSNVQHAKESSTLKIFAQKPSIGSIARDEEQNEWRRKHYRDDNQERFEAPAAYNHINGVDRSGARALIDAYGNDHRETTSNNISLLDEHLDANGLSHKTNVMSWQNTEEEEFDWEDMSSALADRGRSNGFLPSWIPPFRNFNARPGFRAPSTTRVEHHMSNDRSSQAHPSAVDDTSVIANGSIPSFGFDRAAKRKILHFKSEVNPNVTSPYPHDPRNMSHPLALPSDYHPNLKGRGRGFQMSSMTSGISSVGEKVPFIEKLPDYDSLPSQSLTSKSRMGSTMDSIRTDAQSVATPASARLRPPPNMHSSRPLLLPSLTIQNQRLQRDYNSGYGVKNLGANESFNIPEQHFHNQTVGLIPVYQPNRLQNSLQPQYLPIRGAREPFFLSTSAPVSSHMLNPNIDHGYASGVHGGALTNDLTNPVPLAQPTLPTNSFLNSSLQLQGGSLPSLPRGRPPSQALLHGNNVRTAISGQQPSNSFSGLINSLMAQGLISMTKPAPAQDSVGIEFNPDLLKVRHEYAINALYSDLPRQCTTCGLRFKCQEEHSHHMDWHVTKNRMSKSHKQKASRKWFVNASVWLSGAEALGTDAVPGFLPTEPIVESKADEEMAVPADEDQSACALCGEAFEDFYSDETEEWMYKGAVYLNAPVGSTAGMGSSQLGPIVHAKCRSQSSVIPPEDYERGEGGPGDKGSQRKRLRS